MIKKCTYCGETKPLNQYHRHPGSPDKLYSFCKLCRNAKQRDYIRRNPSVMYKDTVKQAQKRYRKRHSELLNFYSCFKYWENPASYRMYHQILYWSKKYNNFSSGSNNLIRMDKIGKYL